MPNTPLWRRSSVRSANPCAFASRTDLTLNGLPVLLDFAGLNRTQAEQSLDHLGTLRAYQAADAKISPLCSSNDTCWNDFGSGEHRSSTLKTTSFPGV